MSSTADSESGSTIVFIGDSLTATIDWSEALPGYQVHNLGRPGATSDDLMALLPAIVEIAPDDVAIMIGSNDFGAGRNVEHVVRNIEFFLVSLRKELPEVRTLLQSILPRGREYSARVKDANRHLRQFSATVHAQFLDLWPTLALDDGELSPEFTEDRLRLNEAGAKAWISEFGPAIDRLRNAPPMSGIISVIPQR